MRVQWSSICDVTMVAAKILFVTVLMFVLGFGQSLPSPVRFSSEPVQVPNIYAISVIDPQHLWVDLAFSSDGGGSWTRYIPPVSDQFDPHFVTSHFVTSRRGWLNGTRYIWQTNDGGSTWSPLFAGHFHMIGFSGNSGYMAVGDDESARNYITRNGGETWSACGSWQLRQVAPLASVSFVSDRKGWITVARYDERRRPIDQGVAKTEDGGCTWTTLWWNPGPGERLGPIRFVDETFGWLGIDRGRLLVTRDGGEHWQTIQLPGPEFYLEDTYLIDRQRGWISGSPRPGLYYTIDSGRHWRLVSESDVRTRRGAAQNIPPLWGTGRMIQLRSMRAR